MKRHVRMPGVFTSLCLVFLIGCGEPAGVEQPPSSPAPPAGSTLWPAPSDPMALAVEAGLEPASHEFLDYHVHAHLDVFVDGERIDVPAGIGIDIDDPAVRVFEEPTGTAYGGIDPPCQDPCISPLHTHSPDGVLHTESAEAQPNTLGQFFVEWGVTLEDGCVGEYCEPDTSIQVHLDGEAYEGDPADIELTDGLQIAIVIGLPPSEISPPGYNT
jgi:hypothetical protein